MIYSIVLQSVGATAESVAAEFPGNTPFETVDGILDQIMVSLVGFNFAQLLVSTSFIQYIQLSYRVVLELQFQP